MPSKRGSGKRPMEWKADSIATTSNAVTNGRIVLGLRDDEIAEIHKIDSTMSYLLLADAADGAVDLDKVISMDPDVSEDPSDIGESEDLEKFFYHTYQVQQEVGAAGTATLRNSDQKTDYFNPPILVGTDVGQVVKGHATIACDFLTRVFFTRRKATAAELNQILLKRR